MKKIISKSDRIILEKRRKTDKYYGKEEEKSDQKTEFEEIILK